MLIDIVLACWLLALTGYLAWQKVRARRLTVVAKDRLARIDALRARQAAAATLLTQLQSPDAETRTKAAKALIAQRAHKG